MNFIRDPNLYGTSRLVRRPTMNLLDRILDLPVDIRQIIFKKAKIASLDGRRKNPTLRITYGKDQNIRYEFDRIQLTIFKDQVLIMMLELYNTAEKEYSRYIENMALKITTDYGDYLEHFDELYEEHSDNLVPTFEVLLDGKVIDRRKLEFINYYDDDKVPRNHEYYLAVMLTQNIRDEIDLDYLKQFFREREKIQKYNFNDDPWEEVDTEQDFLFPNEVPVIA